MYVCILFCTLPATIAAHLKHIWSALEAETSSWSPKLPLIVLLQCVCSAIEAWMKLETSLKWGLHLQKGDVTSVLPKVVRNVRNNTSPRFMCSVVLMLHGVVVRASCTLLTGYHMLNSSLHQTKDGKNGTRCFLEWG